MKKIEVEITEKGSYVLREGIKESLSYNVDSIPDFIPKRCGNKLCTLRKSRIPITSTVENMIASGKTEKEFYEHCRGNQPGQRGSSHSCGHSYEVKIVISC